MTSDAGLALLARSIARNPLGLREAAPGQAHAWCDGHVIHLPHGASDWRSVATQACIVAGGSLDPAILRTLIGRERTARRYLLLEIVRLAPQFAERLPWRFSTLPELQGLPVCNDRQESLKLAESLDRLIEVPDWLGTIRPLSTLGGQFMREGPLSQSAQVSDRALRPPVETGDEDPDRPSEESVLLRLFQNPIIGNNWLSQLMRDLFGSGSAPGRKGEGGSGGEEMPVARMVARLRQTATMLRGKAEVAREGRPEGLLTRLRLPEWDHVRRRHRPDWVWVEEVEPPEPEADRALPQNIQAGADLHRQLAPLGLTHRMTRRQSEGSDLDIEPLLECAIELSTRHSPPALPIYRASRRTRRDLAVAIALDISGSTASGMAAQDEDSQFQRQIAICHQLGQAFYLLGDMISIFGFHGWGRKLFRAVLIKSHAEPWDSRVRNRLRKLEPLGFTRSGAAIRYGCHLFAHHLRLPNRLLIVITDGLAYDHDYENAYADADLAKALEEARSDGIGCVCIAVGAEDGSDRLCKLYGAANLILADRAEQLLPLIRKVCRDALATAAQVTGRG